MKLHVDIVRHRKENLKKCSLRGLEEREDFDFYTYPLKQALPLKKTLLLTLDAPCLKNSESVNRLLLVDGTWRYAEKMLKQVINSYSASNLLCRSLPEGFQTAYPRRQEDCPEPSRGLASVEALYIAFVILGAEPAGLLAHYPFKDSFLMLNKTYFQQLGGS